VAEKAYQLLVIAHSITSFAEWGTKSEKKNVTVGVPIIR